MGLSHNPDDTTNSRTSDPVPETDQSNPTRAGGPDDTREARPPEKPRSDDPTRTGGPDDTRQVR
jgi:hypothetical protein